MPNVCRLGYFSWRFSIAKVLPYTLANKDSNKKYLQTYKQIASL